MLTRRNIWQHVVFKQLVIVLSILVACLTSITYANDQITELSQKLEDKNLSDNDRAITLKNLAWQYRQSDITLAKKHASEAVFIASRQNNDETKALCYTMLGIIVRISGDFDAAEQHLLKAIEISESINDPALVSSAQNALASVYRYIGRFDLALGIYNDVLTYKQSIEPKRAEEYQQIAIVFANIASI